MQVFSPLKITAPTPEGGGGGEELNQKLKLMR